MTSTAPYSGTAAAPPPIDIEDLAATMRALLDDCEDPIGRWMRAQGFDPARGGLLVLPASMWHIAATKPAYVLLSRLIEAPMLTWDMLHPQAPKFL